MSETKEYSFKRKHSRLINNLGTILLVSIFINPFMSHADHTLGKIYLLFVLCVFAVLVINEIYIIITKKYKLPDLIISDTYVAISKWFLRRYDTIKIQKIIKVEEQTQVWENRIEITLINNKSTRLSLNNYSDSDKQLISGLFKKLNTIHNKSL